MIVSVDTPQAKVLAKRLPDNSIYVWLDNGPPVGIYPASDFPVLSSEHLREVLGL